VGGANRRLWIGARADGAPQPNVSTVFVSPRYFEVLDLPLVGGRAFTTVDGTPGHDVVIVNRLFADRYFPSGSVIGQQIRLTGEGDDERSASPLTIVGIAPTVRQRMASGAGPVAYLPLRSHASAGAALIVRGVTDPGVAARELRARVAAVDPTIVVSNVRPLADLRADSRLQPALIASVLSTFAAGALLLAVVGLYASVASNVRRRQSEIGVRMALGARRGQIVWLFVRNAASPLVAGVVLGLLGAVGLGRVLHAVFLDASATDPAVFAATTVLLVVVMLGACVMPARRAARIDPVVTLRGE
jgi:putative ABC transport system permease protein